MLEGDAIAGRAARIGLDHDIAAAGERGRGAAEAVVGLAVGPPWGSTAAGFDPSRARLNGIVTTALISVPSKLLNVTIRDLGRCSGERLAIARWVIGLTAPEARSTL